MNTPKMVSDIYDKQGRVDESLFPAYEAYRQHLLAKLGDTPDRDGRIRRVPPPIEEHFNISPKRWALAGEYWYMIEGRTPMDEERLAYIRAELGDTPVVALLQSTKRWTQIYP